MRGMKLQSIAVLLAIAVVVTVARSGNAQQAGGDNDYPTAPISFDHSDKVCRLAAIGVPYEHFKWFVDHDYDMIARVSGPPDDDQAAIHALLEAEGIEHLNYTRGSVKLSEMDNVPPERRGIKRGPGANKYINLECVCGGWDAQYRFRGRETAAEYKSKVYDGVIFEDYLNRSLCYCSACEAEYHQDTGEPGFPDLVYPTPHYEDTVSFDPTLIAWDQKRTARNFRIMAEPIHEAGKQVAVAGVSRWIVGPEAAEAVDKVMFYTYYSGRRLPANYMRNWKYWHDHVIDDNLWLIFGYFRQYHTCHTRLMLANLPDGVNLAFWACYRQCEDPATRADALWACDVAHSSLVPIRVAVYDSPATKAWRQRQPDKDDVSYPPWASEANPVDKAVIGFERLGLDAQAISTLDKLDKFDLLYLEDVECLSQAEVGRIAESAVPLLATGLTGLRDENGRLWGEVNASLPRAEKDDAVLNLPSPVALQDDRINIEIERMRLAHPWFEFMFEHLSPRRGDKTMHRPYTDPSFFEGVRKYALSLIPSRVYGEFLSNAFVSYHSGIQMASSSETRRPMIVYNADARQVYSTVKFSDYVNIHDLTECGYGYQMRQFCFLQIADALTLPRRGVSVEPYLMTAVRTTGTGHFLTLGNVYDESKTVTLTLAHEPAAVRVNHEPYRAWRGRQISLPPIPPKDAVQVHVDY